MIVAMATWYTSILKPRSGEGQVSVKISGLFVGCLAAGLMRRPPPGGGGLAGGAPAPHIIRSSRSTRRVRSAGAHAWHRASCQGWSRSPSHSRATK